MAYKKITRELAAQAAKCKTEEEKKLFERRLQGRLEDEMLDCVSGGSSDEDTWECEVCGDTFDSFWKAAGHAFAHIPDVFD